MSLRQSLSGGVTNFAHLNGPVAKPAAAAAPIDGNAAVPEDPNAVVPPAPQGKKAKKVKKAKDDNADDEDDDDEDGDDESDEEEMRATDDEDADDDMKKKEKAKKRGVRAARLRERARCAAIFGHEAAGKNPALAARLAFSRNIGRAGAVDILKDAAAYGNAGVTAGKTTLAQRMAGVEQPTIDASTGTVDPGAQRAADRVLAARDKARGKA